MTGTGRLERYVVARNVVGFSAALAVISALLLLILFVDLSRTVGVRADVGVGEIFGLTLLKAPSTILVALPFVFLFGGILAFDALNNKNELVVMRAAGMSAWRFILPTAGATFLLGVVVVTLINPVSATMAARFEAERGRVMQNYLTDAPEEVWLRQGDGQSQIVIHAKARDTVGGMVRLHRVSMFIYQQDANGILAFKRRLEATEARLMPGFWKLIDVREATPGEGQLHSETQSIRSTLDAEGAMERLASPDAIGFWRLPQAIRLTEQAGFGAGGYRLRFQQLLATPALFAAMSILAAAFSLRLARLGGRAALAGAGVGLGFVFFFFNEFAAVLADADIVPMAMAAWAPPLVALLSGVTLLCYTEDG